MSNRSSTRPSFPFSFRIGIAFLPKEQTDGRHRPATIDRQKRKGQTIRTTTLAAVGASIAAAAADVAACLRPCSNTLGHRHCKNPFPFNGKTWSRKRLVRDKAALRLWGRLLRLQHGSRRLLLFWTFSTFLCLAFSFVCSFFLPPWYEHEWHPVSPFLLHMSPYAAISRGLPWDPLPLQFPCRRHPTADLVSAALLPIAIGTESTAAVASFASKAAVAAIAAPANTAIVLLQSSSNTTS